MATYTFVNGELKKDSANASANPGVYSSDTLPMTGTSGQQILVSDPGFDKILAQAFWDVAAPHEDTDTYGVGSWRLDNGMSYDRDHRWVTPAPVLVNSPLRDYLGFPYVEGPPITANNEDVLVVGQSNSQPGTNVSGTDAQMTMVSHNAAGIAAFEEVLAEHAIGNPFMAAIKAAKTNPETRTMRLINVYDGGSSALYWTPGTRNQEKSVDAVTFLSGAPTVCLFLQGEANSNASDHAMWSNAVNELVHALRLAFGNIPVIIHQAGRRGVGNDPEQPVPGDEAHEALRGAQFLMAEWFEARGIYFAAAYPFALVDNIVHFYGAGGAAWALQAHQIYAYHYGLGGSLPPKLTNIEFNGAIATLTYDQDVNDSQNNFDDVFRVDRGGTNYPVVSAVRDAAEHNKINITIGQTVPSTATVTITAPMDNTAAELTEAPKNAAGMYALAFSDLGQAFGQV